MYRVAISFQAQYRVNDRYAIQKDAGWVNVRKINIAFIGAD